MFVYPNEFARTSLQCEWGWMQGGLQDLSTSGWRTTKQPPVKQKILFPPVKSFAMINTRL